MHKCILKWLAAIFVMFSCLGFSSVAKAEVPPTATEDTELPIVESLILDKVEVEAPGSIQLVATITDDVSGVNHAVYASKRVLAEWIYMCRCI